MTGFGHSEFNNGLNGFNGRFEWVNLLFQKSDPFNPFNPL